MGYDNEGNLICSKITEGHEHEDIPAEGHEHEDIPKTYYEVYYITQYNETGKITEYIRQIMVQGKKYTVYKEEYQYDEKGRLIEVNEFEMLGSNSFYSDYYGDVIRCSSGENIELHITKRYEFEYGKSTIKGRVINYKYEANKDYSVVNLIETKEGEWWNIPNKNYWTITYYTEEEVEKYLHDKEFSTVN